MTSAQTLKNPYARLACVALFFLAVPASGQEVVYRLNAGGSWYTDTASQVWEPDTAYRDYGYVGITSTPISGTLDDTLYQSERYGVSWQPEFAYHLPLLPGSYTVRLHFAEIYGGISASNPRVFDVLLEGYPALEDYSILATAGYATAVVEAFEVVVNDTELDIEFIRSQENPKVSAIEVLTSSGPEPQPQLTISPPQLVFGDVAVNATAEDSVTLVNTGELNLAVTAVTVAGTYASVFDVSHAALPITLAPGASTPLGVSFTPNLEGPFAATVVVASNDPAGDKSLLVSGVGMIEQATAVWRVNAGGPGYADPDGNFWSGDAGLFNTGGAYSTSQPIAGTGLDPLYQSERYDTDFLPEMTYSLPVDPGVYTVNLHFAEIYFTNPGQRVFDVLIEGSPVLTGFDIVDEAGPFTATVQTFEVDVLDSALTIQFIHDVENPKVSAIEVLTQGAVLTVEPASINFGTVALGTGSDPVPVTVSNNGDVALQLEALTVTGANAGDFAVAGAPSLPANIPAGGNVGFNVTFAPQAAGQRGAAVEISISGGRVLVVPLSGVGEVTPPPQGALYRVNAGGPAYTDGAGNPWVSDTAFYNVGYAYGVSSPISGTDNDTIYQTERWSALSDPDLVYSFPLEAGGYKVRLHFAEIYSGITAPGHRVFSVLLEGQPVLSNFDIYAEGGPLTAVVREFNVDVEDGSLQIQFQHGIENPKVSGIEILGTSDVTASMSILNWGHVLLNTPGGAKNFSLTNTGPTAVTITSLGFFIGSGTGQNFTATVGGTPYTGAAGDVTYPVNVVLGAGASTPVSVAFNPTVESINDVSLTFAGGFGSVSVQLLGTGIAYMEHPYLHVVIQIPAYFVDYDMDGLEEVFLRGDLSHTDEVGHNIVAWQWSINGVPFASTANTSHVFPLGYTTIMLTIWDNSVPAESLSGTAVMHIVPGNGIPGTLVQFYESGSANPATLLDNVPAAANYGTKYTYMYIAGGTSTIVPSPYSGNVMVQLLGQVDIATSGSYAFQAAGGSGSRLFLNGTPVSGPVGLSPGRYSLEARFAVPNMSYLPASVLMSVNGGPFNLIPAEITTHSQLELKPVINVMPSEGSQAGGYELMLFGMGFTPLQNIIVHWGGITIPNSQLTVQSSSVRFIVPPGTGTVNVTVENPYGVSNVRTFKYVSGGALPIEFSVSDVATGIALPTVATWGADGRLYVGTVEGAIHALTLDADYNLVDTQTITTIQGLGNSAILGVASSPFDSGGPVKIYVAHSELFANGGTCFTGFSPYSGQVSVLTGPAFAVAEPVITGLPVSNHDHGVNALEFDNNGDLLVCVGGNTNAGVLDCDMGGLDESPLSGAILKANLSDPAFNGEIVYIETGTGEINMDQSYGGVVDVAPGVGVEVLAAGFRNTFDLALTRGGLIYCMDNGPNLGFGPASTGPDTQTTGDVQTVDSLNLVQPGHYYGHPNRNRGRYDVRQNVWYDLLAPSEAGVFMQGLAEFPASTNGIFEYTANTFNGAMRGNLVLQQWNTTTYRAVLDAAGTAVTEQAALPAALDSLDVVQGPGGAIVGVAYVAGKVVVATPVQPAPVAGFEVYDILPWRASADGGRPFVIGGAGFGPLADTTVSIGGIACTLTSVTPTRIHGTIPPNAAPTSELLDVSVTSDGVLQVLPDAFLYLAPPGA